MLLSLGRYVNMLVLMLHVLVTWHMFQQLHRYILGWLSIQHVFTLSLHARQLQSHIYCAALTIRIAQLCPNGKAAAYHTFPGLKTLHTILPDPCESQSTARAGFQTEMLLGSSCFVTTSISTSMLLRSF
jgi:hypothetical protein